METETVFANPYLCDEDLQIAKEILCKGGVLAIPTETVYGLAGGIFHPEAIEKIFQVKGRPSDNPLIVHVGTLGQVDRIAKGVEKYEKLLSRFWPGPLTVILQSQKEVPRSITAGLDTVAIRFPSHLSARQLLSSLEFPLAAPSANLSGTPSPTCAQHVYEDFHGKIPLIIDGGICSFGMESTVISLQDKEGPLLLRHGAISKEELEEVLERPFLSKKLIGDQPISPGLKYRHYAPKAFLEVIRSPKTLKIALENKKKIIESEKLFLLSSVPLECPHHLLTVHSFYSQLRLADQQGAVAILIYLDPRLQLEEALLDRIERASMRNALGE